MCALEVMFTNKIFSKQLQSALETEQTIIWGWWAGSKTYQILNEKLLNKNKDK